MQIITRSPLQLPQITLQSRSQLTRVEHLHMHANNRTPQKHMFQPVISHICEFNSVSFLPLQACLGSQDPVFEKEFSARNYSSSRVCLRTFTSFYSTNEPTICELNVSVSILRPFAPKRTIIVAFRPRNIKKMTRVRPAAAPNNGQIIEPEEHQTNRSPHQPSSAGEPSRAGTATPFLRFEVIHSLAGHSFGTQQQCIQYWWVNFTFNQTVRRLAVEQVGLGQICQKSWCSTLRQKTECFLKHFVVLGNEFIVLFG